MIWILGFFFVSGFCSLLYEVIWMRLAMANFGVTTALTSIVISMFMAGLGVGSWASGVLIRKNGYRFGFPALRLYALLELLIGISSVVVPLELAAGQSLLGGLTIPSSILYYVVSGAWIAVTLIPWCACMGATIPVVMLAIQHNFKDQASRGFSFLYLSNVMGAVLGALAPLVLVELYGFHGTLRIGAAFNALLAVAAFALTMGKEAPKTAPVITPASTRSIDANRGFLLLLFGTGFTSMGIEVVWIRQYTPTLGTLVYAFAAILAVYLAATFIGSQIYRVWSEKEQEHGAILWSLLGFTAILSAVATNPYLRFLDITPRLFGITQYLPRLALGIAPFSAVAGFATPLLVDRWSGGDPDRAGRAYAANVAGCILGPLVAGFVFLPLMNERMASLVFALPWLVIGAVAAAKGTVEVPAMRRLAPYALGALALVLLFTSKQFEEQFPKRAVERDNTATVVAVGEGWSRKLVVNGVGMTWLTPDTKTMAHLPLASLDHKPQSALTICFGMGTTFRSLLSWGIPTTVVELVPSVPKLFWYFHSDASEVLSSPNAHVVIDDGRRFLDRTSDKYDVIVIDPPPPVEAAASSLLYSREFYAAARKHLQPGGVLQQWLTHSDPVEKAAITRAVIESFPYVRMFHSVTGGDRIHYLASNQPIAKRTAAELVQRMPAAAVKDLIEFGPEKTAEAQLSRVVNTEFSSQDATAGTPNDLVLVDDRPQNEYFFVRQKVQGNKHFTASAKLETSGVASR